MMASNACSGSEVGHMCVGQIYITKQQLRDRIGLMALKNHFQFKVFKSYTTQFEAKFIVKGCNWQVCAINNNYDAFFKVIGIKAMHTCINK